MPEENNIAFGPASVLRSCKLPRGICPVDFTVVQVSIMKVPPPFVPAAVRSVHSRVSLWMPVIPNI